MIIPGRPPDVTLFWNIPEALLLLYVWDKHTASLQRPAHLRVMCSIHPNLNDRGYEGVNAVVKNCPVVQCAMRDWFIFSAGHCWYSRRWIVVSSPDWWEVLRNSHCLRKEKETDGSYPGSFHFPTSRWCWDFNLPNSFGCEYIPTCSNRQQRRTLALWKVAYNWWRLSRQMPSI